jgi:hypothetical protein
MKLFLAASTIFASFGGTTAHGIWTATLGQSPSLGLNTTSTGTAEVVVNTDGTVKMDIKFDIKDPSLSANNSLIGMHIHAGNSTTNGPIVFGFCGQDPLPPFGGACKQDNDVMATYSGMICNITTSGTPCYDGGVYTATEAVQALTNGEDSKFINMPFSIFIHLQHGPLTLSLRTSVC